MAVKKGNSTKGKKPAARKKSGGVKKTAVKGAAKKAAPQPPAAPARNKSPLYILVIMALLAVILLLANYVFFHQGRLGDRSVTHHDDQQKKIRDGRPDAPERKDPEEVKKRDDERKPPEDKEQAAPERMVKIFFIRVDDRTEKMSLAPVKRAIQGDPTLQQALAELIKGPTAAERRKGLLSAVPAGLRVRGVSVKGRVAEIDFNSAIEQNAAGSVLIGRLDQIVYTATELGGVDSVVIKINGRRRQFIGSDGLSVGGPMHRRQ